jgi:hypothetical protein
MLDRWIPEEDWVCQIRYNGDCDCTVSNLNMGMSKQCLWQNNCAILQGMRILYNKKHLLISKTKVTKKAISFYYVLGAGKPVPTVPSDQGFNQSLWDDQDRRNRSLKRLAPAQTQPPPKKANASLLMPITPEPSSNIPMSPSAPKSFEKANRMIQEAWKVAFPSLRFPVELVGGFPSRKSPLVAAPHEANDQQSSPALMHHQSTNLKVVGRT